MAVLQNKSLYFITFVAKSTNMKEYIKPGYAKLIFEMLKADKIIDEQEIMMFNKLCQDRNLSHSDLCSAHKLTLSEACQTIAESNEKTKKMLVADLERMSIIDGSRSREEALLLLAIKMIVIKDNNCSIVSVPSGDIDFTASQVLYLEKGFDRKLDSVINDRNRELSNALRVSGFEFIHIPTIARHYAATSPILLQSMMTYMSPALNKTEINNVITMLQNMTTRYFKSEILESRLNFCFPISKPSLIIKLGNSTVNSTRYSDFLQMRVTQHIIEETNNLIDIFNECECNEPILLKNTRNEKGSFIYDGFYKTVFDMATYRRGSRNSIIIDTSTTKGNRLTIINDRHSHKLDIGPGELALYVFILCESALSADSGIRFNNMGRKSCRQALACYETIYRRFSMRNTLPDITKPSIRNPMLTRIKNAFEQCKLLDEKALFSPQKDENKIMQIAIDISQIKVIENGHTIDFDKSELCKTYESTKHNTN